jgi:hypothetical protein
MGLIIYIFVLVYAKMVGSLSRVYCIFVQLTNSSVLIRLRIRASLVPRCFDLLRRFVRNGNLEPSTISFPEPAILGKETKALG